MSNETEAFLAHYGVKGMKWGVRRAAAKAARAKTRSAYYAPGKANVKANKGSMVAATLLLGPFAATALTGPAMAKAGYSTGVNVATHLILGPVGGALMTEIAIRNKSND